MNYRNEYEFRVFSIKRNGNHAIISWLASLFNTPTYFFNQCDLDPFRTQSPPPKIHSKVQHIFKEVNNMFRWDEEDIAPIRKLNKECLIHSYENKSLKKFQDCIDTSVDRDYMTGKSKHNFNIIILRDLYNFTASTLMLRYNDKLSNHVNNFNPVGRFQWIEDASHIWTTGYERMLRRVNLWKEYAKEFVGDTNHIRNKLVISFNDWFKSEEYRKQIADTLDCSYSDITLNYMLDFGHGSSFSNMKYNGKATEMNVLNRWEVFKDNNIYWDLINKDSELSELSYRIFGDIIK